jgi:O-Antigen ligase
VNGPTVSSVVSSLPSSWPKPQKATVSRGLILFIGAVVALCAALLLLNGDPLIAALPLLVVLLVYAFLALPLRAPMFTLVFLAALSDALPVEHPGGGFWSPPFTPLYTFLFDNLNKSFPIEALRFSSVDVLYVLAILLVAVRVAMRIRVDSRGRQPTTVALYLVLGAAFAGSVWLELWGVGLRGGDFKQSLWQMRQLFWFPTVTLLFTYCIRDARDFNRMITLMIVAACIKIWIAAYYFFTVARPAELEPATLTSHYDSILFVVALMALIIRFLHGATWKNLSLLTFLGGYIMLGIVLNNRRLAFVNLLVSLLIVLIILRGPVKKSITKILVYSMPLIIAYVAVGANSNKRIFKPAKQIMSVINQDDRSSDTRDVENYNLLVTLKQGKVIGSGWGHEYIEMVKGDDISGAFAQYRYIAHNSVLWLWSIGGLVGFTLLWMPISVGIFFARRAYAFARTPVDRSAAALSLVMLVIYMMQAWGDIGTQGLNSTLAAAPALAMAAKLAVSTGAFPSRLRLFGMRKELPRVQTSVSWPTGAA